MNSKRLSQETKQTFLEPLANNKNGVVKEARIKTSKSGNILFQINQGCQNARKN